MRESYAELWRALQLYSAVLPTTLAQQFIRARFRDIRRKRLWSWRLGTSQIILPDVVIAGNVNATQGSSTILGIGTAWDASLIGRQFRTGNVAPIYTIVAVNSPTELVLDDVYGNVSAANVGYQILQCYLTPPPDFQDFISVKDIANNWRLHLHISQEWLDTVDAQRAQSGTPYGIADFRYGMSPSLGSVGSVVRANVANNLDATPVSSGTYVGRTDSIFTVIIQTTGVSGAAVFGWSKDGGTLNSGLTTTAAPFVLQEGVNIQFPDIGGNPYIQGDVFVFHVKPGLTAGLPQYEIWPYGMFSRVYPFLYDKRFPDIDDPNGVVPPYIDADVLIKGALADVCRWRGLENRPNPMYGLDTAISYEKEFQLKVAEMEREDDEVYCVDVRYQLETWSALDMSPFPMGANWAQSHAVSAI